MEGLGYSLIVKYLPTMHKALGRFLNTIKTVTKNRKLHLFISRQGLMSRNLV